MIAADLLLGVGFLIAAFLVLAILGWIMDLVQPTRPPLWLALPVGMFLFIGLGFGFLLLGATGLSYLGVLK
jgi:hypothetical protein